MKTLPFAIAVAAFLGGARLVHAECSGTPACTGGPVRIMFVVDASSDLLNDGTTVATMGTSDWDLMRDVIAVDDGPPGDDSIFSAVVDTANDIVISQIAHVGLIAFGDPGQEVRVIDYAPCARDNLEWALDPRTSCAAPGCTDPWSGPPIEWTFVDGSDVDPPGFVRETLSTMPQCDGTDVCGGSGRAVHAGITLATMNQAAYEDATGYTHDDGTIYVNILLVTDSYAPSSTDMQVQEALGAAFLAGITTNVVAFGHNAAAPSAEFMTQLDDMAAWGSGGSLLPQIATNEDELHAAVQQIVAGLALPCCYTIDCSGAGGADGGGIGNDDGDSAGTDDAADGSEWGSLDGDGGASAEGADASADGADASASADATADATDGDTDDAGFDDDGGCRCTTSGATVPGGLALGVLMLLRRRKR